MKLMRNRVVAGAAALVVALFGGITAQLVSDNDPAPANQSTTTAQQKQDTLLAPVTTRQS